MSITSRLAALVLAGLIAGVGLPAYADGIINGGSGGNSGGSANILYVTLGSADDSVPINAAIAKARAQQSNDLIGYTVRVVGNGTITHTVNETCFNDPASTDGCSNPGNWAAFKVDWSGAYVACNTNGAPCIDGMGSRYVTNVGGTFYGNCSSLEPSFGIQFGRTVNSNGANDWHLDTVRFQGCYTKTPYYNLASEDTTLIHSYFQNLDSTGAYACVWDGGNFYQVTSAFVTVSITQYQNQSFNGNTVVGGDCIGSSTNGNTSGGIFIYGTRGLRFENLYVNSGAAYCVDIFNDSGGSTQSVAQQFFGDLHCEAANNNTLTSTFLFTAKTASTTSTLPSFRYHDYANEAVTEIFKLGTNVSAVVFDNEDFDIPVATGTPAMFDTPADYTVTNIQKDYIATAITGWLPTNSVCTGLGSGGTCQIINSYYSGVGLINLGTASSGTSDTGGVNITYPYNVGANLVCIYQTQSRTAAWTAGATTSVTTSSALTNTLTWLNGSATNLTGSSHYGIYFHCGAS